MSRIQKEKTKVQYLTVTADQASRRIDNYLVGKFGELPKTRIYQMLRRGEVRVNKGRIKQNYRIQEGDLIRIPPMNIGGQDQRHSAPPYLIDKITKSVIFEDDELIVLNKPAGIVVHSGSGRSFGVIELLRQLRPEDKNLQLVHRLDRETSGCLLIAKTMRSLKRLHQALKNRNVTKQYRTMLAGVVRKNSIEINLPLQKNALRSGERIVTTDSAGKHALTYFEVEKRFTECTLVRAYIETGRTHQIRVHANSIGHPILGDDKYGDEHINKRFKQSGLKRLFLHASMLKLPDLYGKKAFTAPLPDDLAKFMKQQLE